MYSNKLGIWDLILQNAVVTGIYVTKGKLALRCSPKTQGKMFSFKPLANRLIYLPVSAFLKGWYF